MNRIFQWFYGTWLGGKYLEFLLWWDDKKEPTLKVSSKEVHQIVVQAQQMAYREGLSQMKLNIHKLVSSKTKEEYTKALASIENLIDLASVEDEKVSSLKNSLYKLYVRTNGKDINNSIEHAKMLDQRINDKKELWEHQAKRKLIRDIRALRRDNKISEAEELEKQFKEKYARRY